MDVALAAAFALAVERPDKTGPGGGGFLNLAWGKTGDQIFYDFRETAPKRTKGAKPAARGAAAVATPGFVAGLWAAHKKAGALPWAEILQPAIRLAKEGIGVDGSLAASLAAHAKMLCAPALAKTFCPTGQVLKKDEILRQPELAVSLESMAAQGAEGFYRGEMGQHIAQAVSRGRGLLSVEDLAAYEVKQREPLRYAWAEYELLAAPPPSTGGIFLAQVFKAWHSMVVEERPRDELGYLHWLVEFFKRVTAEDSQAIGDPDFVSVRTEQLNSDSFIRSLRMGITERAVPSAEIRASLPLPEKRGTVSVVAMDDQGNAVSLTASLGNAWGSGVTVPGSGFFLNNQMAEFSTGANAPAPGHRPMSTMAPALILRAGKPILALSAAGGARIPTALAQAAMNYLWVYGPELPRAVYAPRAHHGWLPDKLELDGGISDTTRAGLSARGHVAGAPAGQGLVNAVSADSRGLNAVYDPRGAGGAEAK